MRKIKTCMASAMLLVMPAAFFLAASNSPAGAEDAAPGSVALALDDRDAVAALDSINIALTEVGDGGSYVWHRVDGWLSGMAQPTSSYKGAAGQPCRHLVVILNVPGRSSKIEGVACRTALGQWLLEG